MYYELLPSPLIIEGEVPSRANLAMNWKLKNVPAHKIKNKSLRYAKERWDHCLSVKDTIALQLRSEMNRQRVPEMPASTMFWVSMVMYFEFKKSLNPAEIKKDIDNAYKLLADAVTASGAIQDDSQITQLVLGKQVDPSRPRLEILSITASDTFANLPEWFQRVSALNTNRIFSHLLDARKRAPS